MRGYLDGMGMPLGKEIEAIIPYNLVPHLKWLADPEYCHVYYVDLKPKAFDARIFPDDDKHPNGWGTVLVCGMRFGGTEYNIPDVDNFKSAYFALDITDPEDIEFMWEINWDDLAFTTSYPGVVKSGDKWFVLAGSGPTSVGGSSSQYSKLYIIDVSDTSYYRALTGSDDGHFGDPTPVDVDLDGNVDVIYIGESYWFGSSWKGKIYKIITHESDNLNDWDIYTFLDVPGPVTAGGAITMDDQGRVWVYFGSGRYYSDIDETDYSTKRAQFLIGNICGKEYHAAKQNRAVDNPLTVFKGHLPPDTGEQVQQQTVIGNRLRSIVIYISSRIGLLNGKVRYIGEVVKIYITVSIPVGVHDAEEILCGVICLINVGVISSRTEIHPDSSLVIHSNSASCSNRTGDIKEGIYIPIVQVIAFVGYDFIYLASPG